jgi:glycosyltransferase involved in cell wall biosynthesis
VNQMATPFESGPSAGDQTFPGRPPRIAAVFDTSVGYGSPQLEYLTTSLAQFYRADECWLIEPDVKGKRGLLEREGLKIRRTATRMPAHGELHHIDYNIQNHRWLRDYDPDIVIVTSGSSLPAVLRLPRKPPLVIYYMLENIEYQRSASGGSLIQLNRMFHPWIDLICVPEIDRAGFDLKWLGWETVPTLELLNVSLERFSRPRAASDFRILHAGSICEDTLSHYLADASKLAIKVDAFGILATQAMRDLFVGLSGSSVAYRGVLTMSDLDAIYNDYAYSLVMWRPSNINQIYASPNKFFQSIARGVPPIAAPHPQCARIIRKYGCGILMEDWTPAAFTAALLRAQDLYGSSAYEAMVERCRAATEAELNWPAQFAKVEAFLHSRAGHAT